MIDTNKTHDISRIYHQTQSPSKGAPAAGDEKPPAIMPVDRVSLSRQALEASSRGGPRAGVTDEQELTAEEKEAVKDLKQRDAAVKAHEQAHLSAGAGVARGGASYEYQTGPDGRMYAVGGEVQIDLSGAGSPEATIRKMQQIQAAALAPAQPSGTDRAVAAQAAQIAAQARMEKTEAEKEAASTAATTRQDPADPGQPARRADTLSLARSGIDLMA